LPNVAVPYITPNPLSSSPNTVPAKTPHQDLLYLLLKEWKIWIDPTGVGAPANKTKELSQLLQKNNCYSISEID
jgi:hypothetical protein